MTELELHRRMIAADLRTARSHMFSALVCLPSTMTDLRSNISALISEMALAIASPPLVPTVSLDALLEGADWAVTEIAYATDPATAPRIASRALQDAISETEGHVPPELRDLAMARILSAGNAARLAVGGAV